MTKEEKRQFLKQNGWRRCDRHTGELWEEKEWSGTTMYRPCGITLESAYRKLQRKRKDVANGS